ncbi:hypothetical protein [Ruegeria arenilitoris]|uniref:hypothetical protein n=1 Tax=Ruegeria arenilitoris TaxID=1173585 RepID=UPI00147C3E94|nr:hypothetical protein [Ruegeria arenilitoris]
MIWKTKTHEFSATVCQRTGKTCPALAQVARVITQAIETAAPATTPDFQVEGSSELSHCPEGCTARFRARQDQIRVYCGAEPDVSTDSLDSYADMMFTDTFRSLPADVLAHPPCAMLEVSTLAPSPVAHPEQHAAL